MNGYFRSYVRIDLDAIAHNINEVKKRIPSGTKVLAVVKTNAYGHGAVAVSRRLHEIVDYFAVADLDEAVELRDAGITKPILILGYTSAAESEELIRNDISQTVYNYDMARFISDAAVRLGSTGKIHIAADTGMTRIGYDYNETSMEEIVKISRLPNIDIEGLFTHFSCADMCDKTYSIMQMKKFEDFNAGLKNHNINIPNIHMCNSAGIVEFDDNRYDMVRSGIITYGLLPSDEVDLKEMNLKPALEWKAHVVNLKTVPAGVGVSYGATYVTDRETKIATVSVGYGDGYPRSLSSRGKVIIKGKFAPIIGRVCMDQMMVDVTDIDENICIEDEVTLVGQDGGCVLSVEDVAEMSGRFNYEFVCDIGRRVTRVYE